MGLCVSPPPHGFSHARCSSNMLTSCPASANCSPHIAPEGPPPIIAISDMLITRFERAFFQVTGKITRQKPARSIAPKTAAASTEPVSCRTSVIPIRWKTKNTARNSASRISMMAPLCSTKIPKTIARNAVRRKAKATTSRVHSDRVRFALSKSSSASRYGSAAAKNTGKRAQRTAETQDSVSVTSDQPVTSRCSTSAANAAHSTVAIRARPNSSIVLRCTSSKPKPVISKKLAKYPPLYIRTNENGFQNRNTITAKSEASATSISDRNIENPAASSLTLLDSGGTTAACRLPAPTVSRTNGPASNRIPANPKAAPTNGAEDGTLAGDDVNPSVFAAQSCAARITRASNNTLTCVARGTNKYALVPPGSSATISRVSSRLLSGSNAALIASVCGGSAGGLAYGSISAGAPCAPLNGAGGNGNPPGDPHGART